MNNKQLQIDAIQKILNELYYQKQFAFNHDCARCGNYIHYIYLCDKCKQYDERIEIRISEWEQKLLEVLNNEE